MTAILPQDAQARKAVPLAEGVLWYFPNALAEVARVSKRGNEQHNAGEPLHWAREKSTDHADCILRHLIEAGTVDGDGQRHTAKVAWRALALLETELIREGATPGRNAVHVPPAPDHDPASVAFRHGLDVHPSDLSNLRGRTAPEIAADDGVSEYGNPITPGCAPWRLP